MSPEIIYRREFLVVDNGYTKLSTTCKEPFGKPLKAEPFIQ
jgi:hypothetical protein